MSDETNDDVLDPDSFIGQRMPRPADAGPADTTHGDDDAITETLATKLRTLVYTYGIDAVSDVMDMLTGTVPVDESELTGMIDLVVDGVPRLVELPGRMPRAMVDLIEGDANHSVVFLTGRDGLDFTASVDEVVATLRGDQ